MQPDRVTEASRWYEQAVRDLDDARFCFAGRRYNLACFVAQQAAEKALKAFLLIAEEDVPWGHSVAELCKQAAALDQDFAGLMREAAPLDKFYIPTRYPNGLPGGIPADAFSREDAQGAVDMAEKVFARVAVKLPWLSERGSPAG